MKMTIATLGELLVEFLAKKENQGFRLLANFGDLIPVGRQLSLPIRSLSWAFSLCCLVALAMMPLGR